MAITLQPSNVTTFQQLLILSEDDLGEHGVPERRSIAHRGKAQGKQEMFLYAHHWVVKFKRINVNMQAIVFSDAIDK
jgi:hypothetical protein